MVVQCKTKRRLGGVGQAITIAILGYADRRRHDGRQPAPGDDQRGPGIIAHPARNYETDQSAKLSIDGTGTSFIAGQTLSTADDKWLRRLGAEQKLFDGVTVSGSIGETASGAANKSISAGFKRTW